MLTLAVADNSSFTSSITGYIIATAVVVIGALGRYVVGRNDRRSDITDAKIDKIGTDYNTLNLTVAMLGQTVTALGVTVTTLEHTVNQLKDKVN